MENKKTCADCINLGREVYCMKCKRLKNGYKDLFVDAAPVQAKPPVVTKSNQKRMAVMVIRFFFTVLSAYTAGCSCHPSYGNAVLFRSALLYANLLTLCGQSTVRASVPWR